MSIETQLQDLLKEAMRNRDARTADCVRMIKTKHMERRTAAGFKGALDDALWLEVIAAYQKQLRKAREEYGEDQYRSRLDQRRGKEPGAVPLAQTVPLERQGDLKRDRGNKSHPAQQRQAGA